MVGTLEVQRTVWFKGENISNGIFIKKIEFKIIRKDLVLTKYRFSCAKQSRIKAQHLQRMKKN